MFDRQSAGHRRTAAILRRGMAAALLIAAGAATAESEQAVNVYSYRQPFLVEPLFDAFTESTGIEVNVVFAKKGLVERLRREGRNSPADLVFTVDIGRLSDLHQAGLTSPVRSEVLRRNIPPQYRHPEGHWFGMTTRARIIVVSRERVAPDAIAAYEDLADDRFEGRVCTRSGKHPYMIGLIAAMIAHHGEEAARRWLVGLKENLARRPQGNDRAQVRAVKEGVCDVAVINHYYMGKMLANEDQAAWAKAVRIVFPNQGDRGTHVNVSGVALARHAPNRENAVALMEFLSTDRAQTLYAEQNYEYPVKEGVEWSGLLRAFGDFKADTLMLERIASLRAAASKLVDIVDYDG